MYFSISKKECSCNLNNFNGYISYVANIYIYIFHMSFPLVAIVLDTAAGVWLDRNGLVTSSRSGKGHTEYDPSLELMRRCRHAAASVGVRIYVFGGLRGGKILGIS